MPPPARRGEAPRLSRERLAPGRLTALLEAWPAKPPRPLEPATWQRIRARLQAPAPEARADLTRVLGLIAHEPLPRFDPWVGEVEPLWASPVRQPLPDRWARLVVPDWRAWLAGAWTPVLRALILGERLVLLADGHLPELLDPLFAALRLEGADLSGICVLWEQRNETVAALLETGVFPEVRVVAPGSDRVRWQGLISKAARLREAPPAVDLVFGFGVQPEPDKPHLEFESLTSSCRNLEKPMLQAGEKWEAVLERALFDSLSTQGALGGYLNGAVGQWILPASHFSRATEWLLRAIEIDGILDPAVPPLNRASKAELEQVRARALGEGATLIHGALGSTGQGQNGTLTRQIFTNVRPGSGLSLAPGNTPTLLLSRGDLGPYEAPYKGGIR